MSLLLLDVQTAEGSTTSVDLKDFPAAGYGSASFLWEITAAPGSWTCEVKFRIGAEEIVIASHVAAILTGMYRLNLLNNFELTRSAIPMPTRITYTRVSGTLTSRLYGAFGA